jgi:type IV pilus assembly protein PilO
MNVNLPQLNALRPILGLPVWQCVAGLVTVVILMVGGYIFAVWVPLGDKIDGVEKAIQGEQRILQRNRQTARDLPRKKLQFEKMKNQLKLASSMLPEKSQIPDLLDGVSRAGKHAGLEFSVFQPLAEVKKELHAEVPVSLSMTGTFRQIALFLSTVGEMQRIVEVKGLSISQGNGDELQVKGRAVTYRLLDDQEIKQAQQKPAAGGRKR